MNYFIFTLGCQMNLSDSQRIASVLESCGLEPSDEKSADLIVVNACSVRQSAVDRIYGKIKNWQGKKIIITGCLLPEDRKKLNQKVDLIFKINQLPNLPQMLSQTKILPSPKNAPCPTTDLTSLNNQIKYLKIPPKPLCQTASSKTKKVLLEEKRIAFVPIMTGCNNFCTYCAVPHTRGREISRPEKEIIQEIKEAVARGVKEIVLLGQNVNRYRQGEGKMNKIPPFIQLLNRLVKIPGNFKIKFLSPNPWDFPDELIELIATQPKLSKEIHLPVQSGDDEILQKMNRPYTAASYLDLVSKLKKRIPQIKISTDIIVGFPGETQKAFQNTVALCRKAKFHKAYIALYSPRPGTIASKFKDDVKKSEKIKRWRLLNEMINETKRRTTRISTPPVD